MSEVFKGICGNEEGVSILEFAAVLPVLVVLIVGLVEVGGALHRAQVVTEAAREGARVATSIAAPPANAKSCSTLMTELGKSALQSADKYLTDNSLNGDAWQVVLPNAPAWRCESGTPFPFYEVTVQRNPAMKACLLCSGGLFDDLAPGARSSFRLKDNVVKGLCAAPAC